MEAESPVWVVEHSMAAGIWTDEARTSESCRHGLGRAVAQCHGDLGLQLKPWNLKGWNTEKARLTNAKLSRVKLRPGQARRACQMGSIAFENGIGRWGSAEDPGTQHFPLA